METENGDVYRGQVMLELKLASLDSESVERSDSRMGAGKV
jgi:hypothetical protein